MNDRRNWLERSVFWSSCLLVAGVLAYLAVDAWTSGNEPPELLVTLGTPLRGAMGWRVPVTVENLGDSVAEQVRLEVVAHPVGQTRERAELLIDFVPRHSRREGWVSFPHEPLPGDLEARTVGYTRP